MRRLRLLSQVVISLLPIILASAWNIALEVTTQVDGALGGEPFLIQPSVIVTNKKGEHQSSFEGRVSVQLNQHSNEVFEPVWKEGSTSIPTENVNTHVSQDVIDGRVDFDGLGINAAGIYQIKFILYDEHDLLMTTTVGDNFTVSIGEMYQLGLITQPESALGGSEFEIQPILSVQDRGGNTVENINEGMVTVSLENAPERSSSLHSFNEDGFKIPIKNGVAQFKGLFINDAALEYSLHFSTDLILEGARQVSSNTFSVGIGPAAELNIVQDASHGSVIGGKAFASQPRIEVRDAGGNVLKFDSSSAITVSFFSNPSQGLISPLDRRTTVLEEGVVQFRRLAIDKAGFGYRLKYEFLHHDGTSLQETSLVTLGSYFNVEIGPPHRLSILRHSSGGWAGNQPFLIQPKVALVDAGGNVVSYDSSSMVTAHLTPSLTYDSKVIINTVNDATPSIVVAEFAKSVTNDGRALYGPGDVIHIDVIFDQEVTTFSTMEDGNRPRLMLNVVGAYAELIVDESQHGLLSRKLSFSYLVQEGHSQLELDYLSRKSLLQNDFSIEDAFGRSVSLILPALGSGSSLSASKTIGISDMSPTIESIGVDMPSGEYGVGQVINFSVSFDREVNVAGTPLLQLNTHRPATYTHGSGTNTIYFEFRVIEGDSLGRLEISTDPEGTIILPSHQDSITLLINGAGSSPITAHPAIGEMTVLPTAHISIDTNPPTVVSISPQDFTTPDGTYAVGDTLMFVVLFDKPVEVRKGLELTLSNGRVARYISGSGTDTILLRYTVAEHDTSSNLGFKDPKALISQNTERGRLPVAGYVRRISTFPTTDAILDLSHLTNFSLSHTIQIDGERPRMLNVSFDSKDEGRELRKGDLLTVLMQFNAPVAVNESLPPVLGLLLDGKKRWATYSSGSGSSVIKFGYQISLGDDLLSPLDFKYTHICTYDRDCTKTDGLVVRLSDTLTFDANVSEGFADEGVQIADSTERGVTINTSKASVSTVVAITTSKASGAYGVGEIIDFDVKFSDEVVLFGRPPVLWLNTNNTAGYRGGNETDTLIFRYIVSTADSTDRLDFFIYSESYSAIECSEGCEIKNANGVAVDTTFRDANNNDLVETYLADIVLDPSPSRIISVETDKAASSHCHPVCSYTVGEEIRVSVIFDKAVAVSGNQIYVKMDVTDDVVDKSNKAIFLPKESSPLQLVFLYTIGYTHTSHGKGLRYVCDESDCSIELGQAASIKRASSIPTVEADLTLPPLPDNGISTDESGPIIVDTFGLPRVISVFSISSDGQYSPGDVIEICVLFSKSVIAIGEPFLTLDVGVNEAGIATYKSGSGSSTLMFEYKVGNDHFSLDLDYTDAYSLHVGFDGVHSGSIKQTSTNPTADANTDLPVPGAQGSLGINSDIQIDNRRPFINRISAVPGEYSTGDEIVIQATFSRPVVITGNPSLRLETGNVDRVAEYKAHSNYHIEFSYTVQLGDTSESLNYWSSEELLPSSTISLRLNDGWIKLKSLNPQLDADLHINPVDGYLDGDVTCSVTDGIAVFRELKIGQRGSNFKIWFRSEIDGGAILETEETIEIEASIEYEVQGELTNRDEGDLYGNAVALDKNVLAVGAPARRNPSPEVQVLTVYSKAMNEEHEVQIISTSVNVSEAIRTTQVFSTCADPEETIRGTFKLTYVIDGDYPYASPIELDANVSAEQLRAMLETEWNLRGLIDTTRSANPTCSSQNGWVWSVTFFDSSSGMGVIKTDGYLLIGKNANITETTISRHLDMLRGSFVLANLIDGLSSRELPFDASSSAVKDAIEQDLLISVKSVQSEDIHEKPELGRRWTVIFSHQIGEFGRNVNIPLLQVIYHDLQGKDAHAWTHTVFEGRGILNGTFAMSFRDSNPSYFVSHDSSEMDIKAALESLDSINEVLVTNRREFQDQAGKSGFSWVVTFKSVNKLTDYGWVLDPEGSSSQGNLPSIQIISHLTGWSAGHEVRSETGKGEGDTQSQWMEQKMGDDGRGSGAVDVFRRVREIWQREASLSASDFDSNDAFGSSVSVKDDFLLVGAPSKQVNGLPAQQLLTCNGPATKGFFTLNFRGFHSSSIPHNANLHAIQQLIEGLYGETSQIHSMPRLLLSNSSENWDGLTSGFCDGEGERSITITFLTPDGGGVSTVERRSGDLEVLSVDSSNLVGASMKVVKSRIGTNSPTGRDLSNLHPTGKQAGSVYLYQRYQDCNFCTSVWTQVMKFTPMTGLDDPTDAARFGNSVVFVSKTATASALAIIGSPGFNHESGKVYIFHNSQGSWTLLDSLTDSNWNHDDNNKGRFGSSLHEDRDTVLIGSPGYSNGRGAVYVFRRSLDGKHFLASQAIYGPSDIEPGNNFGHSISLSENKAVICAPYKTVTGLQVSSSRPTSMPRAGACYAYSRKNEASVFLFDQQLVPSNIFPRDRFGWDVSISGSRVLVGQVEKSEEKVSPPRPVQVVKTFCNEASCGNGQGSMFKLYWSDGDVLRETLYLSVSVSASQLRKAIETNLNIGDVSVNRSILPDKDGGHEWHVTFDSYKNFRSVKAVPTLKCEMFIASNLSCKVQIRNDFPRGIRSKAHIFDYDDGSKTWTEQAFLFPTSPQSQDYVGTSVVIDGNFAAVGAPNREWLNVNSGAVFLFDIRFLNLRFTNEPYTVVEGETKMIELERSESGQYQLVSLRTADRNAEDSFLNYVSDLFSLQSLELSAHDFLQSSSTAFGRTEYYGSDERCSSFISGIYDFQGVSDYAPVKFEALMKQGEESILTTFATNKDNIMEKPDEYTTVQVNLRGMFASRLGRLTTNITILGSSDDIDSHYEILGESFPPQESARMGAAVAIDRKAGMIVVGSDQSSGVDKNGNQLKNVGSTKVFKWMPYASWEMMQELTPPNDAVEADMKFGSSVAIHKPYGRDDITLLIGAPGTATVHVFVLKSSTNSFVGQAILSPQEATTAPLSELRFGGQNSIALQGDMAFIGSSFMEAVYVFRRSYVKNEGFVKWDPYSILRSSDYDYDLFGQDFTVRHIHRQNFGVALTASARSLLVGAPFADYGNRGDVDSRERFDTDGIHNPGLGKGKVYAFYSQPHTQIVTLQSDEIISSGSFRLEVLNYQRVQEKEETAISGLIPHNASPSLFERALEEIAGMGKVDAEIDEEFQNGLYTFRWRVTFSSNFQDEQPVLRPRWKGNGCEDCEKFVVSVLSSVPPFLDAQIILSHQPYNEEFEIQPADVVSTDLFGASLSLDGPQAIIGSKLSAAKTRTVWDFETGDLQGWTATGDAFRFQPTFGDNSKHRPVYEGFGSKAAHPEGNPQSSHLVGNYYIGTFERFPGDRNSGYQKPDAEYSVGSTQGDDPTGTLTSEPFLCLGESISFRIGGGCNHLKVYVELLVDGYPSLRATGKCNEGMDKVNWDVSTFTNRACQIRIVDQGTEQWEHINVDQFEFDWEMGQGTCLSNNFGQCSAGGGALPKKNQLDKQHYTGREETPTSGAAYLFIRECQQKKFTDMSPSNVNCTWTEQERIVASDKRAGNHFGISVDVDHEQGVAIVGSSNSQAYGFYNDPIFVHPHSNLTTVNMPIPEYLQDMMRSGGTYSATGGNLRVIDYLIHQEHIPVKERMRYTEQAGSTYVFIREPANIGPRGAVVQKPFWKTTEDSKFAPPDIAARDHFGFSVAMEGLTAVIGAIGRDTFANNGGGAFMYNMEWVRVKFSKVEYVALEGSDHSVKIFLERDLLLSNSNLSIGYSTSDLSAIGVDTLKFDECLRSPVSQRDGCGDYEQAAGEVTFKQGEKHTHFTIRVMDDRCIERRLEYVQLNLHQLGGSPLRGEKYRAQLRIDDNDWHD